MFFWFSYLYGRFLVDIHTFSSFLGKIGKKSLTKRSSQNNEVPTIRTYWCLEISHLENFKKRLFRGHFTIENPKIGETLDLLPNFFLSDLSERLIFLGKLE